MADEVRETGRDRVVVEKENRSNWGVVLAVILILALIALLFFGGIFGGGGTGTGDTGTDINIESPAPTPTE